MEKLDLKKQLAELYRPSSRHVVEVDVPRMDFLMIDGQGDPGSDVYSDAVEALFSLSYALKFAIKKGPDAIDYGVMPLEGLWWADDMTSFTTGDRDAWKWTMMIMQPTFVTPELVETVSQEVARKKNPTALSHVRFDSFEEGLAAQIMHIGPFSEEGPTIERVHAYHR